MVKEWIQAQYADLKGHLKFAILAALWGPMVFAFKRLLREIPFLPNWGVWTIVFVVSFAVFLLILRSISRASKPSQQSVGLTQGSSPASVSTGLNAPEFFRLAYYSPLQAEVEKNIRNAADLNQPNDREGFYVKFIGVGLIAYLYDTIWFSIYRSQLLMLLDVNKNQGVLPLAVARAYYDKAALDYPDAYANYSFDQWLDYMKTNVLLIRHPSDMLEITAKGKDFLKYLLHWGREAAMRLR
jgi:hypothetical protein